MITPIFGNEWAPTQMFGRSHICNNICSVMHNSTTSLVSCLCDKHVNEKHV